MITKELWKDVYSLARSAKRDYQCTPKLRTPLLESAVAMALYLTDPLKDKQPGFMLRQLNEKRLWAARRADPLDPANAAQWNCRCRAVMIVNPPDGESFELPQNLESLISNTGPIEFVKPKLPPISYDKSPFKPFSQVDCLCDFCLAGLPARCEFKPKVTGPAGGYADGDSYRQEDDK